MGLKENSLIRNFIAFVQPLTDQEVIDLHQFIFEDYEDKTPNELQKQFIDEFISFPDWGEYITYIRRLKVDPNYMWRPMLILENVTNLRNFLGHETAQRYRKYLAKSHSKTTKSHSKTKEKREESFKTKLKKELKEAIENSYYDGVFDKCDGWCNIADVLEAAGLITYKDTLEDLTIL